MASFEIPDIPPTTNKSIRIPNNLVEGIENAIRGKNCTFTEFVVAAIRAALCDLQAQEDKKST